MNRLPGMWGTIARSRVTGLTMMSLLTACGGGGGSGSPVLPPTVTMSLSSQIVPVGQSVTLAWSSTGTQSCTASLGTYSGNTADTGSWMGSVPTSGTKSVTPTAADYYTYNLMCTGDGATTEGSTVLTVSGPTHAVVANEGTYNDQFIGAGVYVPPPNQIVGVKTTLTVPPFPPIPSNGYPLFIWPGLESLSTSVNFAPVNRGILQPVLGYGDSCGRASEPPAFQSWWVQPYYYNGDATSPVYGCSFGNAMMVNPGDSLIEDMELDAGTSLWTQTVTDTNTQQTVTWSIGLLMQNQNYVLFMIEAPTGVLINTPVTFSDTTITFETPDTTGACSSAVGAKENFVITPPTPASSGAQCRIASMLFDQASITPSAPPAAQYPADAPSNRQLFFNPHR
jgi:hypothetical protein